MNVLFLTMVQLFDLSQKGVYTDLMCKFRDEGHKVYIVSPRERWTGMNTSIKSIDGVHILGVRTLNIQKTGIIEKGVGQLIVGQQYKSAIKRYLKGIKFDLILYSTPPNTLSNLIRFLKVYNYNAKTYLLLKDIFPQNAVDLGMIGKTGVKGLLYYYFRRKERKLYTLSDHIGCMSPANIKYITEHNKEVSAEKVEEAPNSYEVAQQVELTKEECDVVREQYNLPINLPIYIYGGNLGRPQGIPFLIQCLDNNEDRSDCYFVIVGDGTEYSKLEQWYNERKPKNVSLFHRLPKDEYNKLVRCCDVGLIFLDYRFTIPNFPSRLLSYLMEKKPIIAATDLTSDIGTIAEANGYGFWCPSNDVAAFSKCVNKMLVSNIKQMGEAGYQFYLNNYTVEHTYNAIMKHF